MHRSANTALSNLALCKAHIDHLLKEPARSSNIDTFNTFYQQTKDRLIAREYEHPIILAALAEMGGREINFAQYIPTDLRKSATHLRHHTKTRVIALYMKQREMQKALTLQDVKEALWHVNYPKWPFEPGLGLCEYDPYILIVLCLSPFAPLFSPGMDIYCHPKYKSMDTGIVLLHPVPEETDYDDMLFLAD